MAESACIYRGRTRINGLKAQCSSRSSNLTQHSLDTAEFELQAGPGCGHKTFHHSLGLLVETRQCKNNDYVTKDAIRLLWQNAGFQARSRYSALDR
jgi:hypothetical protein